MRRKSKYQLIRKSNNFGNSYSHRGPDVSMKDHNLVVKLAKKCLREICKKQHEIYFGSNPINYGDAVRHMLIYTENYSRRSWGSYGAIKINVGHYFGGCGRGVRGFTEYKAFADDPVIGSYRCNDWELLIFGIVAHEVSHHIQDYCGKWTRHLKHSYKKPHGHAFQNIYRTLRRTLVNPLVEESNDRNLQEARTQADLLKAVREAA